MENYRAIPDGYMTVGELAKKMDTTVRTLQYYDKEGLLSPSAESEGGRRLYTDKDMFQLHQIMSFKSLGFSLDDIKNRLNRLDTPEDVAKALEEQAAATREKIESLSESLATLEALSAEVLQMNAVDFKKYADIITNIKMKNEYYWVVKHFDDTTLEYFRKHFTMESGLAMLKTCSSLIGEAERLYHEGVPTDSEQAIGFAGRFWNMILEFTGGDMTLLPRLLEVETAMRKENIGIPSQEVTKAFIEPALEAMFELVDYDPLEEVIGNEKQ